MRHEPFLLGKHAFNGREIFLTSGELRSHALIVGGTRRGKSKFAEHAGRYFLRNKIPQLFLDPHGDSAKAMLAYAAEQRLPGQVIYIDPNLAIDTAVYPLNFLKRDTTDISTHAGYIMQAIAKVFREENAESKPRLERRERATLMALIEAGYTLAEMMDFLRVGDSSFRKHVLTRVQDHYTLLEWQEFESIQRRADKELMIESCLNRAAKMLLNQPVRRCLGTDDCALEWDKIIREGKSVIVNLQPRRVGRECMQLIGTMIIHHLAAYGTSLEKEEKPANPLYVLCDELDELASPDFANAMQALGKREIFIWGFVQYLEQLKDRNETSRLYHSAMTNCDIKLAFHSSYEDAKLLVRELFAGEFRGDVVKDEITHTLLYPRESVRKVLSRSESETESESSGYSSGHTSTSGHADSFTSGLGSSTGTTYSGDGSESGASASESELYSAVESSSYNESDIEMETSVSSKSKGRSRGESEIPFYEYLERQELSSRTYYSIDEIVEKYIAFIQMQPQRYAQVKVRDHQAAPIIIPFVEEPVVRPKDVQKVIDRSNAAYALLPAAIDKRLEERRVIQSPMPPNPDEDEEQNPDDKWQQI